MCGISGYSGHFDSSLLTAMNHTLSHRGPDGAGTFVSEDHLVGLAHRRLAIIDLSEEATQPMQDVQTRHVITYNGELYNYRDLRQMLIQRGVQFKTASDTEVVLKLYAEYGVSCLDYLEGIYAFGIYDQQKKTLFLARDGFGVKPLYYAETEKGFLFASELKALLQSPAVSRTLDYQTIDYHLRYLWSPAPHTMLKQVKKLAPGFALLVKEGQCEKQWQFYDLPYETSYSRASASDLANTLEETLSDAVHQQLVSDVPVGAFLSGGLDSSAIVALAKARAPDLDLPCFTLRFSTKDSGQIDELPYAQHVAKHLKVPLSVIDAKATLLQNLPAMVYALDEPQADPAAINTYLIAKLARDQGIKVLLSGAGGDDLLTGYRRHQALMWNRYLLLLPYFLKTGIARTANAVSQYHPILRRLGKGLAYLDLPTSEHLISYFHWLSPKIAGQLQTKMAPHTLFTPDILHASLQRFPTTVHPLNQLLYLEAKHFLADHNLNYTDKMAMAAGVEVRVPFLDQKLAAFAASLPIRMKQRGRQGKWLLKEAMKAHLPKTIIHRPKTGFGVPLRSWLQSDLKPMMQTLLNEESLKKRGIFNPKAVSQLINQNAQQKIDATYPILSLMCIELWCQTFLDHPTPQAVYF